MFNIENQGWETTKLIVFIQDRYVEEAVAEIPYVLSV